jgi:dTDP-glucose 4,6-dehydratase
MKVVVFGGAGFIGSHLCDRLLQDGHGVICVDNLLTGRQKNVQPNLANPDFSFIKLDICADNFGKKLEKLIYNRCPKFGPRAPGRKAKGAAKIDFVVNLASPASPVDYQKYPLETLRVGSIGVFNTLEFARRHRAKYLFSSTSEVYGDPEVSPQKETYWGRVNPVGPRSQYDEAKRFAEALIVAYRKKFKLDAKIVRIFNTYGPRMRKNDGRVVPNFISQAMASKPLTIYGSGRQTRSFCYVDDMVEGIIRMMRSREVGPVNLGNPREFTVNELAKLVSKLVRHLRATRYASRATNHAPRITHLTLPLDDPLQRRPAINLARRKLGWSPRVNLTAGLKKTIASFKEKV